MFENMFKKRFEIVKKNILLNRLHVINNKIDKM